MPRTAFVGSCRVLATLLIGLMATTPAGAQVRLDDWAVFTGLDADTRVQVTMRDGRANAGRVATAAPDAVTLKVRWGRTQVLARADVREVRLGHRMGVAQFAGLGLLAGGVAGLVAGRAAACNPNVCGGEGGIAVAGGLVFGTLVGGIAGVVTGEAVHARPGRLIYTAAP